MPKDRGNMLSSSSVSWKGKGRRTLYKPYSMRGKGVSLNPHNEAVEVSVAKDWEGAVCPICMEAPHNAVLLLCSSHDKGCRPYMCDTSYRHSNCFDQYRKAYDAQDGGGGRGGGGGLNKQEKVVVGSLMCPLCRGKVKGWEVVGDARAYLNAKPRGCAHESCSSISGTYEELRDHARSDHPSARPYKVDPVRQREWRQLEQERDIGDLMSTIQSAMPGTSIHGDYVIDEGDDDDDIDDDDDDDDDDNDDNVEDDNNANDDNIVQSENEDRAPNNGTLVDDRRWWAVFLQCQVLEHSERDQPLGSRDVSRNLLRTMADPRHAPLGENGQQLTSSNNDSHSNSVVEPSPSVDRQSHQHRRSRHRSPGDLS